MTPPNGAQAEIPFVLMRGGTSKAVFLRDQDLPRDPSARDRLILALFGSPDRRQIDGLGGADLLTSKVAVIAPPSRPDADLDYTFGQVSVTEPVIDHDINCGNISAAVGIYAVDEGLVVPREPVTRVRVHNTNTGRLLVVDVPVEHDASVVEGDLAVDGVPGTGAPIILDYADTAGGATGALLPTGSPFDALDVELPSGRAHVAVSIVDLGNLSVFVPASAVGMAGGEGPEEITEEQLAAVAAVKTAAAKRLGMTVDGLVPVPVVVSGPASYRAFTTGEVVDAGSVDLVARVVGGRPAALHRAYPGTVGACTAVAAALPGSVVAEQLRAPAPATLRIGHPSGVMPVTGRVRREHAGWRVEQATYLRTARRLAQGTAFVRRSALTS